MSATVNAPVPRLRLGRTSAVAASRFRLYIPTRANGELTIDTGLLPRDITVSRQGFPALHTENGATQWRHDVGANRQGWYWVDLDQDTTISCTFVQSGRARVGAAPGAAALVPWKFYYWPYSGGHFPTQAAIALNKYADAVGTHMAGSGAAGTWETTHHDVGGVLTFEGHCHAASNASAYFDVPAGGLLINGVQFTAEELKLVATEFWANYGNETTPWELRGGAAANLVNNWRVGRGQDEADDPDDPRWFVLAYVKPANIAAVTGAQLQGAFTDCHVAQPQTWVAFYAGVVIATFRNNLHRAFGFAAATFYDTLLTQMYDLGYPLISNMREAGPTTNPSPVWNQAFYSYEAAYVETDDVAVVAATKPRCMEITIYLLSNSDEHPTTGPPAPLHYRYTWRIQFLLNGNVHTNSAWNRWESCRYIDPATGPDDVFAPTDLCRITGHAALRKTYGDEKHEGNPYVQAEFLNHVHTFR